MSNLTPDFDQAMQFLKSLDPECDQHTFQTFDDSKKSKDPRLSKILHGTFEEHKLELERLNRAGAGIFVTVNRTDGSGRKKENITRIRAVFQEDDSDYDPEWPLEPGLVIQSPLGKYHRYFLTDSPETSEFAQVQLGLVNEYGSDPNAKDISRVLRLPGFYHQKSEPKLVEIVSSNGARYSWNEIKSAFPPVEDQVSKTTNLQPVPNDVDIAEVQRALNFVNPDGEYTTWIDIGMALHSTNHPRAFSLWDKWSAQGEKYDPDEMVSKWNSFKDGDHHE